MTLPLSKPIAFFDTECFQNYWLLKFRFQGGAVYTFRLTAAQFLNDADRASIQRLFSLATVVSFNGERYDVPMIAAALSGYSCEQLKWLSDELIVQQCPHWEMDLPRWRPDDHIDLIEVAPGGGSQKQYAGRLHCRTMRDLPFEPDAYLERGDFLTVDEYCEHDLTVLETIYNGLMPQLQIREVLSERYGIDFRSKSDAQLGESIIKLRCERAIGQRIFKPEIDWSLTFRFDPPEWVEFQTPELRAALAIIRQSVFGLGASGRVDMPEGLKELKISLGKSLYRLGIGGLHSSEKNRAIKSDALNLLRDKDVRGYYPRLIINSRQYPPALGPSFPQVFTDIVDERDAAKARQKAMEKLGVDCKNPANVEGYRAYCENEGGKIASNGSFGKLGSPYSILFAPKMLIQTTVGGQLAILMLIEAHELAGIPVVSANTDGFTIHCPRNLLFLSDILTKEWEAKTGLEMETSDYAAIYSRDINNYFALKTDGEVKRKGEYSKAGIVEKKNPWVEICGDAVAEYLSKGTPLLQTIATCKDIRKFVAIQNVAGGGVKMWGEGPLPNAQIRRDMEPALLRNGWRKESRSIWVKGEMRMKVQEAYKTCFAPQRSEYVGKVIRWYYAIDAPGPIIYKSNGNTVGLSYGAKPCMTLPDEFLSDINYNWYLQECETILKDIDEHHA